MPDGQTLFRALCTVHSGAVNQARNPLEILLLVLSVAVGRWPLVSTRVQKH